MVRYWALTDDGDAHWCLPCSFVLPAAAPLGRMSRARPALHPWSGGSPVVWLDGRVPRLRRVLALRWRTLLCFLKRVAQEQ